MKKNSDPTNQVAFHVLKADLKSKKLDITIQSKQIWKEYPYLVRNDATRHEMKHILTSIQNKADAINQILNELNEIT